MSKNKKKTNRLMQSMIGISLVIHIALFMHIAGIYRSNALTCIELAMRDISKPFSRAIPRPRIRHHAPKVRNVKKLSIQKRLVPRIKIDPVKNSLVNTLMENISAPDIPDNAGPSISDWNPGWNPGGSEEFVTSNDYFDMVRLKIESCKKYPESAKSKHIEGRVMIRFVIAANGQISSLKIVKQARHSSLGTAALDAVKKAAPFPRPPPNLFKEPLNVEITILFELT
ncbi:energy transducer TonB family protein [Desulfosarcina sp. BuS5]|uniref:energy transducer TonB family protein n=1 Tax=Desulfosarcina sp. BuS5 TaxID=933262 RepID=UPI002378038E|nr:energy transducer TonB [Desulfosarcina sp. BuS5]